MRAARRKMLRTALKAPVSGEMKAKPIDNEAMALNRTPQTRPRCQLAVRQAMAKPKGKPNASPASQDSVKRPTTRPPSKPTRMPTRTPLTCRGMEYAGAKSRAPPVTPMVTP